MSFQTIGADVDPCVTPELIAASLLIPCMAKGKPLDLPAALDPVLAGSIDQLQSLLSEWSPKLKQIELRPSDDQPQQSKPDRERGVGVCFTGGVDSFYGLIKHCDEIDTLVYVRGFDIGLKDELMWGRVRPMLEAVAKKYGKGLIIVETNLRQLLDEALPWGRTHGTALAAIGHLLSGSLRKLIIPSTFSRDQLHPWGSHPDLDPLWSSSSLEIAHLGIESTRMEKLALLAEAEYPLSQLRVCWQSQDGAYNCSSCGKCFRTMASLEALGVLDRAQTFSGSLDYAHAGRLDMGAEGDALFLEEIRCQIEGDDSKRELHDFLDRLPLARSSRSVPFSVLQGLNSKAGTPLHLGKAKIANGSGHTTLSVPVTWGELSTELTIDSDLDGPIPENIGDSLLLWFVLVAMQHGVPLHIEDEVSVDLLETIEEAQLCWAAHPSFPGMQKIKIDAPSAPSIPADKNLPWASAFSAGVDATFTARSGGEKLQHLVWIDGIDTEQIDQEEQARLHDWISKAADAMGKKLITVRANFRRVLYRDLGLQWGPMYVMAPYGLAHFLSPHISRMLIGSEVNYAKMNIAPSARAYDPVLDHYLSTPAVRIKIHGMTHQRHEKIAFLASDGGNFDHLIVCIRRFVFGQKTGRNCGRCEKCLRTLAGIRIAGAPHPSKSFDAELDLDALRSVSRTIEPIRYHFHQALLGVLEENDDDPELTSALREIVERGGKRLGRINSDFTKVESWRNDPDWPAHIRAHAPILATAALADRPSSRMRKLLNRGIDAEGATHFANELTRTQKRARLVRQMLKRFFKRGGKK